MVGDNIQGMLSRGGGGGTSLGSLDLPHPPTGRPDTTGVTIPFPADVQTSHISVNVGALGHRRVLAWKRQHQQELPALASGAGVLRVTLLAPPRTPDMESALAGRHARGGRALLRRRGATRGSPIGRGGSSLLAALS